MFKITTSRAGTDCHNSLLSMRKNLVAFGILINGISSSLLIFFASNRRKPCHIVVIRITFYGDVGEPTVRRSPMPVFDIGSYFNNISRKKPSRRFAFLLIVTYPCRCNKELTTRMTMPTVAAARFKGHIEHRHIQLLDLRQRIQVCCAYKIRIAGHGVSDWIWLFKLLSSHRE